MWIATNKAFLSIVAAPLHDFQKAQAENFVPAGARARDYFSVRARNAAHLHATFPSAKVITHWAGTDYPARVFVPRGAVIGMVSDALRDVDYENFKGSVKDRPYHDALLSVWGVMNRYGQLFKGRGKPRAARGGRQAPAGDQTALARFVGRRRAEQPALDLTGPFNETPEDDMAAQNWTPRIAPAA